MRIAFKMQLHKDFEAEYKKRHDELWAELKDILKQASVSDYSIFWDEATNDLFGVLSVSDEEKFNDLRNHPVMKKWWRYMKDIMESNEDGSPVVVELKEMFYLQ